MALKYAFSVVMTLALLLAGVLGAACEVDCTFGVAGHHHSIPRSGNADASTGGTSGEDGCAAHAAMHHHAPAASHAYQVFNPSRASRCSLDHVWAIGEQASSLTYVAGSLTTSSASLSDVSMANSLEVTRWLRPQVHRISTTLRI
jgi:hypothetical protein